MTNEEVIKQLKYCKSIHNGSFGPALRIAIKSLEQTRWIPVSERLPADGRYLCDYGDCIDFGQIHNGKWFVDGVVAYMPLPKPYEAESEDE